jgi:menaquinone-dependent protoporphyrinogen oxidase
MKVLVCAASKYGATSEIAQAVADLLAKRGLEVTVLPPQEVGAVEEFDAVVLGSAVYMGQWMKPARELAAGPHSLAIAADAELRRRHPH